MKLLFAIKRLSDASGGAERVLCTVCSWLAQQGHDVTIVTFDPPGGTPFYPLDTQVKKIDLGIGDSAHTARAGETLHRIGALRRFAIAQRPDVAVGFMHSMFVPLGFALAGTRIPAIGSEHIVPEHYRTRPFQFLLLLAATPFLKRITVLSNKIRDRYPYPMRKRMVIMPNPVQAPEDPSLDGSKVILSIGRLDSQKDQAALMNAFARICAHHPEWMLRIVGEGPLRQPLEQQIRELGLGDRISLPGVSRDVDVEYRRAGMFVLPSRYESFGLVTAEAMSYGLAAVGFADCPGTNELIEHERTGILVRAGRDRVGDLASAIEMLICDPELRARLGARARDAIAKKHGSASVGEQWMRLLEQTHSESL